MGRGREGILVYRSSFSLQGTPSAPEKTGRSRLRAEIPLVACGSTVPDERSESEGSLGPIVSWCVRLTDVQLSLLCGSLSCRGRRCRAVTISS